jgi:adenosyl cobinamide kinase/adenosyl cobinamide phosphate guanylyltransferase
MKGDVDRTLQKISQLRSLIRVLPHIPTRNEQVLLEIFETFVRSGVSSEQKNQDPLPMKALWAGFQACWRARRFEIIIDVGNRIGLDLLYTDRTLCTYYQAANQIVKSGS